MNHDVIADKYGRLYQLPNELSLLGHDVYGFCLSYQKTESITVIHRENSTASGMLCWYSLPAGSLGLRIPKYLRTLNNLVQSIHPDVIIGGSDALHTIFTRWLALKTNTPYFIDLYDNFESFGLSKLPGITHGFRKSLQNSRGITTVSDALKRHIEALCPGKPVLTIQSTITPQEFKPCPKDVARKILNLPNHGILIGTAGSLASNRDTETLYAAFKKLHDKISGVYLVIAGPLHGNPPPKHPNIIYLGELPHQQIAAVYSSLDLAVICMRDNSFGRFAFPQKAYEILTCKIPVVAAKVGALKELFAKHQKCLYRPGDVDDLQNKLISQLKDNEPPLMPIPSWHDQAFKIEKFLKANIEHCHFV
jgi:glycosyltransferase involved in cell wall biosynthesis